MKQCIKKNAKKDDSNVLFQEAKKCDFVAEEASWISICLERINEIDSILCSLENMR